MKPLLDSLRLSAALRGEFFGARNWLSGNGTSRQPRACDAPPPPLDRADLQLRLSRRACGPAPGASPRHTRPRGGDRRPNDANHNARETGEVLAGFRSLREQLVTRVESLDAAYLARSAMHPRLHVPMRVVDMMLFHAEHDDHHLARIREVIRLYAHETALRR